MRRWALLFALAIAAGAQAQTAADFRAGTRMVQVDVVVRDSHGPVTGLTKDDFQLFDKGKPQAISVFSVIGPRGNSGPRHDPASGEVSNRPYASAEEASGATVVLIDFLNSPWQDQSFARGQLKKFIDSTPDSDRVALLALREDHLLVLQDFTNAHNRAQLSEAVDKLPFDTEEGQLPREMSPGEALYWYLTRKAITDRMLQDIVHRLAAAPGHRSLVWVTGNFYYDARRRVLVSEDLTKALKDSNVALYAVGARGVAPVPTFTDRPQTIRASRVSALQLAIPSTEFAGNLDVKHFAESTGGSGYFDNDLGGAVAQAIHDSEVTYTLGFYPSEATLDGTWHGLKVKVARKGVDARYRDSYFASSETAPALTPEQAIEHAMTNPLGEAGIGLSAAPPRPGDSAFNLLVNLPDLRFLSEGARRRVSFDVAYRFNGAGPLNVRTFDLDLSDADLLKRCSVPIPLSPNATEVHVVVRDRATGAAGSLRLSLKPQ